MRRTIVISSLEEMCDLMCGNAAQETNADRIIDMLPFGSEVYTDHESMDAVVIKVPKKWWESLSFEKTPETKRCSKDMRERGGKL